VSYNNEQEQEVDETILLVNVKEVPANDNSPANNRSFRATILANAVAEYNNSILEVKDNFINRNSDLNHQDLSDAF
jgi:hypothetical protein